MLNVSVLLLIFGGACCLAAGTRVDLRDPRLSQRGEILYYRDLRFTGHLVENYSDDVPYRVSAYQQGKKDGEEKEFAVDGRLRAIWNYKAGKKDGLQRGWFIEGPKRFEYHYRNGLFEGVQTQWHQNGTVFRQQTFRAGVETSSKILYPGKEIFTNYVKRDKRTYGIDGGSLCMDYKKDGEKK